MIPSPLPAARTGADAGPCKLCADSHRACDGGARRGAQEERDAKLRLVAVYNERLAERERRRAFVAERGLLNVRAQQARERRRGPAECAAHARLRPLARYQSQDAHDAWVGGLLLEGRLRARIQARRAAQG